MDTSFYTAARAARTQQERMSVIANNIANVNTAGYKTQTAAFQDLINVNQRARESDQTQLQAGASVKCSHVNTDFGGAGFAATEGTYDYMIEGEGFFRLQDPQTGSVTYSRNGHFQLSQRGGGFYLVNDSGRLVTDSSGAPIRAEGGGLTASPGIYTFASTDGMVSIGDNEFMPAEKNGAPYLSREARLREGGLEMSNVDLAAEMADTIEASRAYAYTLKMIQANDEIEQTINNLRG